MATFSTVSETGAAFVHLAKTRPEVAASLRKRFVPVEMTQLDLYRYIQTVETQSAQQFKQQSMLISHVSVQVALEKPFESLTTDEAVQLVSDEGFFGVEATAQRLADFVLNGGGEDPERLKAGREGIIKGFNEAKAMWGEELPDISVKTLDSALQKIDAALSEKGISLLDTSV